MKTERATQLLSITNPFKNADEQKQEMLRGFLCVDSPKEGIFNKTIDVCILKGISDGLYSQIDKLYCLMKQD